MGKSNLHVNPAKEAGVHGVGTVRPEKGPGPHSTGKDVSSAASRRDNHPGKKATKAEQGRLVADHSIVADTNTVFPQNSTADKGVAAKESQIKSNRPVITPKGKK